MLVNSWDLSMTWCQLQFNDCLPTKFWVIPCITVRNGILLFLLWKQTREDWKHSVICSHARWVCSSVPWPLRFSRQEEKSLTGRIIFQRFALKRGRNLLALDSRSLLSPKCATLREFNHQNVSDPDWIRWGSETLSCSSLRTGCFYRSKILTGIRCAHQNPDSIIYCSSFNSTHPVYLKIKNKAFLNGDWLSEKWAAKIKKERVTFNFQHHINIWVSLFESQQVQTWSRFLHFELLPWQMWRSLLSGCQKQSWPRDLLCTLTPLFCHSAPVHLCQISKTEFSNSHII